MKKFLRFYKKLLYLQRDLMHIKILGMIAHVLLVFASVYTVQIIGQIVDNLASLVSYEHIMAVESLGKSFVQIALLMSTPFLLEPIAYGSKDYVTRTRVYGRLIRDLFKKVIYLDYSYHVNRETGALITKIMKASESINVIIWSFETWLLEGILTIIFPLIIVSKIDIWLSAIMLGVIVFEMPILIFAMKLNVKMKRKANEVEYHSNSVIVDSLSSFLLMRLFRNEQKEEKNLGVRLDEFAKAEFKYSLTWRLVDFVSRFIELSLFGSTAYYLYILFRNETITVGQIVMVLSYLMLLTKQAGNIFWQLRAIISELPRMNDIMDIYDTPSNILFKNGKSCSCTDKVKGEILIKDVNFSYEKGKKILTDLNIKIEPKHTIAFVGPSGGGKSTITKLLMRFYDPQTGKIEIDGINIKNFSYDELTSIIGMVPQEPTLFNRTLLENIVYGIGEKGEKMSKEQLLEVAIDACKKAQIHDFIWSLPDKYETMVGERGIKLSGGQKQRVAVAQIIIRSPKIVIFDEATSQLDSESEQAIQKAFATLSQDKTTVVIAHRLSTVKNADRIFVVDGGKVVQSGTHDELISKKGIYSNLWKIQSGGFKKA